jgi:hypothetical protein
VTLKIRRAATLVDNKLVVGQPKTDAGVRDVTVPPHVAAILREVRPSRCARLDGRHHVGLECGRLRAIRLWSQVIEAAKSVHQQ